MDTEVSLVDQADAAYTRVRIDPARYAGQAEDCVRRARSAGDVEALLAGLRAEAWARHAVLDNDGARRLLDHGVRLARRHGYGRRLGDLLVTRAVALHELGRYDAAAMELTRALATAPTFRAAHSTLGYVSPSQFERARTAVA